MDGQGITVRPVDLNVSKAHLPGTYRSAKKALAQCQRIDEVKTWSDKAEALRSYARMADDKSLYLLAIRIQSRAIRRVGELLKEIDARGQHRKSNGAGTSSLEPCGTRGRTVQKTAGDGCPRCQCAGR